MSTRRKLSGLAWADTIPDRWDTAKVCLVARLESGHTPSRQHPEYWVPEDCTIPWFSLADVWQLREANQNYLGDTAEKISPLGVANSAARVLPAGTVVLSRTASVGFAGIMPRPMATTQDFANWVCGPRLVPEYLLWAFRAMKPEFARLMMGSTHQTIYMPDIRRLAIPVPPVPEQRAIARLLDHKTAAIDAVIASKKRLLQANTELRQAYITQAVTKGLDLTVPTQTSGIEWIGPIPEHWTCAPLGARYSVQLGKMLDSGREPEGRDVPYLRNANVYWDGIDISDVKTMSMTPADLVRYRLREGDLLVSEGGGNLNAVGKAAIWRAPINECYYQKALHRLRPVATELAGSHFHRLRRYPGPAL